jgi:hypothetical protein
MRCLIVCPGGDWFSYLRSGLEPLGVNCERFLLSYSMARECWSDFGRSQHRRNLDLCAFIRNPNLRPEMALFVAYDDCLEVQTLKLMRRMGVKTICLHVDMVTQWYCILCTGPHFDLVWCTQKSNIRRLRCRGIRAHFMPMAAVNCPVPETTLAEEIRYIGGPQPFRVLMLLKAAKIAPLGIYGHWFLPEENEPKLSTDMRGRYAKMVFDLKYVIPKFSAEPIFARTKGISVKNQDYQSLRSYYRGPVPSLKLSTIVAGAKLNLGFTYMSGEPFSASERR